MQYWFFRKFCMILNRLFCRYVKAALLPTGGSATLTCCTKPISDLTRPRFGENFPLSVAMNKLCTKTLQVNVWSLSPDKQVECLVSSVPLLSVLLLSSLFVCGCIDAWSNFTEFFKRVIRKIVNLDVNFRVSFIGVKKYLLAIIKQEDCFCLLSSRFFFKF